MNGLQRYRAGLLAAWARQPEALAAAWQAMPRSAWQSTATQAVVLALWQWETQVGLPNLRALLEGRPPSHTLVPLSAPLPPIPQALTDYRRSRVQALAWLEGACPRVWSLLGRHPHHGLRTVQWWVEASLAHGQRALRRLAAFRA